MIVPAANMEEAKTSRAMMVAKIIRFMLSLAPQLEIADALFQTDNSGGNGQTARRKFYQSSGANLGKFLAPSMPLPKATHRPIPIRHPANTQAC